ncbi:alkanesulfonate monooxygenase [Paraburkholderia bannensis]|uniref:Alkanesulfonate monooxygenase n=1 Tax=Paraburkholderia bannensis TaxID=765414 RepID=A0A7W9TWG8_9BURK|nr:MULTISPECIES: LLM class flavin-dependent oxidoreductase [Paraburkholderia]MBB3257205.1 alkanesulfonate monooxygenase [Paraburkholderia sp. WP4_3_2]MBB6102399.1 alkanesulfonate monooxygenase [Paraburkholderia bannensis]
MSVEFIGYVSHQESSEIHLPEGAAVNPPWIATVAQAHEYGGFDRVLIAHSSASPDGLQIASFVAHQTQRLGILLAHRPGFIAPTLAARQLATLDHFSAGRAAVHIISGGDDVEQQRDGDWLTHDERYRRTDEYLDIVKRAWTSNAPFDHEGAFYRVAGHRSQVRPLQQPHLPVYFGGSSEAAIAVAGKHADVFALWGESLDAVRETIARVRAAAAVHGRAQQIRFSLSLRPILAPTEDAAWARAESILARAQEVVARSPNFTRRPKDPQNEGSKRLLAEAAKGKVVDTRLWTGITALTRAAGNSTALVGTPQQVADALLEYRKLGVSTFLIRGFDPLEDALAYGRDLLPLVRAAVAKEEAALRAA